MQCSAILNAADLFREWRAEKAEDGGEGKESVFWTLNLLLFFLNPVKRFKSEQHSIQDQTNRTAGR